MSESKQQLLFDGRELQAVDVVFKGKAFSRTATVIGVDPNDISNDDEFELVIRAKVEWVNHGSNHDDEGFGKDEFRRVVMCKLLSSTAKVTAHRKFEDLESGWQEAHGVGTA